MKPSEINTLWDLAVACHEVQGGPVWWHYVRLLVRKADAYRQEMMVKLGDKLRS